MFITPLNANLVLVAGLMEPGQLVADSGGRNCHASVIEEEAFDQIREEQSTVQEAGNRSTICDDTRGTAFRFPETRYTPDIAVGGQEG